MSYVIDAAKKINAFQVQFAKESQNAIVELVKSNVEYIDQRPEAAEPVRKLVETLASVVGSPVELIRTIAEGNKEWAQIWLDFHTNISDALAPTEASTAPSAVGEPTPIKKSGSTRDANA